MPRTGRPRGFDRNEAVGQALRLFWDQGYEATTLAQLKTAMGDISPASFYAAFGSKEALFREALELYVQTFGQSMRPLADPALSPRDAIEQALRASARMQSDRSHPSGCLVGLSAKAGSPENRHIQARIAEERDRNRAALRACVERAIATGELPRDTDAAALATVFATFHAGMSMQARDGTTLEALEAGIDALMRLWDMAATPSPARIMAL